MTRQVMEKNDKLQQMLKTSDAVKTKLNNAAGQVLQAFKK